MVNKIHYRWDFVGLSTDTKPTPDESPKVVNGSTYYESDTSKLFVFYKDTWYERKPLGGGGGGSSYTAGDGINITDNTISVDTETIQPKLTAGTNITIDENNVISAEGGSSVNVVQTIGTSTTDVMSQKAVTDQLFHDNNSTRVQIGYNANATGGSYYPAVAIGSSAKATGGGSVAIGGATASGNHSVVLGNASAAAQGSIAIGYSASSGGKGAIAIGGYSGTVNNASTSKDGAIAIGVGANATAVGEFNIGDRTGTYGYNNSNYRLLTGLYDGQSAHDAATYGQVISYSAINGAGAPTTATEGKYVGQLYYDTTNEAMYFLKSIDTTVIPATYTWESLGGGSSVNVVQTTGDSTTDVMSQKAVTSMVFANPTTAAQIKIGNGAVSNSSDTIAIGKSAEATNSTASAIGFGSTASGLRSLAIGSYSSATGSMAVAAAPNSQANTQGQFDISTGSYTTGGYNSSNYRLLTGLYDGQSAHDAVTVEQVNATIDAINTALSTSIPHIGA